MKKLILAAAIAIIWSSAALAAPIDFTIEFKQLDGTEFKDSTGKVVPLTLRAAAETALMASYPDEQNLSGQEKLKRYILATKIEKATKTLDLTTDEVTLLKTLIAKAYGPLVVGEAWAVLDPASVK